MADRLAVHDALIRFRANASLVALARKAAARDGMTLAELMRDALRRQVREKA